MTSTCCVFTFIYYTYITYLELLLVVILVRTRLFIEVCQIDQFVFVSFCSLFFAVVWSVSAIWFLLLHRSLSLRLVYIFRFFLLNNFFVSPFCGVFLLVSLCSFLFVFVFPFFFLFFLLLVCLVSFFVSFVLFSLLLLLLLLFLFLLFLLLLLLLLLFLFVISFFFLFSTWTVSYLLYRFFCVNLLE